MAENPADLPLFSRAEVAKFLGLPYRQVIRAGAKLNKPGLPLTLSDACLIAERATDLHQGEFIFEGGHPVKYRPCKHVIVNPKVRFGRPTIEGTGTTTEYVAWRVTSGESVEAVAQDYGIDPALVRAAVGFEGR